jgi:hypothetical protein
MIILFISRLWLGRRILMPGTRARNTIKAEGLLGMIISFFDLNGGDEL